MKENYRQYRSSYRSLCLVKFHEFAGAIVEILISVRYFL